MLHFLATANWSHVFWQLYTSPSPLDELHLFLADFTPYATHRREHHTKGNASCMTNGVPDADGPTAVEGPCLGTTTLCMAYGMHWLIFQVTNNGIGNGCTVCIFIHTHTQHILHTKQWSLSHHTLMAMLLPIGAVTSHMGKKDQ